MEGILGELMDNLEAIGCTGAWRINILRSTMTGYTRILVRVTKGEIQRNMKGTETLTNRRFQKLVGAKEWYKSEPEDDAWEAMPPWEKHSQTTNRRTNRGQLH